MSHATPLTMWRRMENYRKQTPRLTPRQRRRSVKKDWHAARAAEMRRSA